MAAYWREQGNSVFKTVLPGLAPTLQQSRLEKAITFYKKSLEVTPKCPDESASAAKNIAVTSHKLANVLQISRRDSLDVSRNCFLNAIKHFGIAHDDGVGKDQTWRDNIESSLDKCLSDYKDLVFAMPIENRIFAFQEALPYITISRFRAQFSVDLATLMFHLGLVDLENKDFKKCLKWMAECYQPIEQAKMYGKDEVSITRECSILEEDTFCHRCIAESIQARMLGDESLRMAIEEEENINMELVHDALDKYNQSVILIREKNVEMEAISLCSIGHVYAQVLKNKDRAKKQYMRAVQLVHSLYPRTFTNEGWFKECTQTLALYQQEFLSAEEAEYEKQKCEILKGLGEEMKLLKEHSNGTCAEFLKLIYEKFPPKNKYHTLPPDIDTIFWSEEKKALKAAMIHYTPDEADVQMHGKRWKVLCEEVMKRLTLRYERLK